MKAVLNGEPILEGMDTYLYLPYVASNIRRVLSKPSIPSKTRTSLIGYFTVNAIDRRRNPEPRLSFRKLNPCASHVPGGIQCPTSLLVPAAIPAVQIEARRRDSVSLTSNFGIANTIASGSRIQPETPSTAARDGGSCGGRSCRRIPSARSARPASLQRTPWTTLFRSDEAASDGIGPTSSHFASRAIRGKPCWKDRAGDRGGGQRLGAKSFVTTVPVTHVLPRIGRPGGLQSSAMHPDTPVVPFQGSTLHPDNELQFDGRLEFRDRKSAGIAEEALPPAGIPGLALLYGHQRVQEPFNRGADRVHPHLPAGDGVARNTNQLGEPFLCQPQFGANAFDVLIRHESSLSDSGSGSHFIAASDQAFPVGHRHHPEALVIAHDHHQRLGGVIREAIGQPLVTEPVNRHLFKVCARQRRVLHHGHIMLRHVARVNSIARSF